LNHIKRGHFAFVLISNRRRFALEGRLSHSDFFRRLLILQPCLSFHFSLGGSPKSTLNILFYFMLERDEIYMRATQGPRSFFLAPGRWFVLRARRGE
jgi:hypothetical protein